VLSHARPYSLVSLVSGAAAVYKYGEKRLSLNQPLKALLIPDYCAVSESNDKIVSPYFFLPSLKIHKL
jgi:hypothetical protein